MGLFVGEQADAQILGDVIFAVGGANDLLVMRTSGRLGFDHRFDHRHHVGRVFRGLPLIAKGHRRRAGHQPAELFDPRGQRLGVRKLLDDVGGQRFLNLLGPHTVEVRAVGQIIHDRLKLHAVTGLEQFDHFFIRRSHVFLHVWFLRRGYSLLLQLGQHLGGLVVNRVGLVARKLPAQVGGGDLFDRLDERRSINRGVFVS